MHPNALNHSVRRRLAKDAAKQHRREARVARMRVNRQRSRAATTREDRAILAALSDKRQDTDQVRAIVNRPRIFGMSERALIRRLYGLAARRLVIGTRAGGWTITPGGIKEREGK